jgi:glucokinase
MIRSAGEVPAIPSRLGGSVDDLAGPVVAVDVGGTVTKAAAFDADLRPLAELRRPTPRTGVASIVAGVGELVDELSAAAGPPAAAGVVVPGVVDERDGIAVFSANLGWRDAPLRQLLTDRIGLPVRFGHDVRTGGLAEVRVGAARDADDALFVPIGTGIAGAVVAAGRIVTGTGYAGEIGHVVVDPAGDPCGCGARGCLETIASAAAIARRYTARTGIAVAGAVDVVSRMSEGDEVASAVWDEAMAALIAVLATAVAVTAPEVVVLGGGLAESGDLLLDAVRAGLDERLTLQPYPRVVPAELGDRAGVIGAAILALDGLRAGG